MEPGLKGLTPSQMVIKSLVHFYPWVLAAELGLTQSPLLFPTWSSGKASELPKPHTMKPSLLVLGKGTDHPEGQPALTTSRVLFI